MSLWPDTSGRAKEVIRFIESLKLWEGEDYSDKYFKLHPYQKAILRRIYGPTAEDGSRLVRTAAIWMARGNTKTALSAAIGLCHLYGPEREAGGAKLSFRLLIVRTPRLVLIMHYR